jgi:N-acetyl-anhydromuramyl-L-alanine amidase AmpD
MSSAILFPDRLDGFPWIASPWVTLKPKFKNSPTVLVIHSGATGAGVEEYLVKPGDGRIASAHLAWSARLRCLVQMVPVSREAMHVGGGVWRGIKRVNPISYGLELPGPWNGPRDDHQRSELVRAALALRAVDPDLEFWVCHWEIEDDRHDPGPGFKPEWMTETGLVHGIP